MLTFAGALLNLYTPEAKEGQGLVEYALIIFLVAVVVIGILTLLGTKVGNTFSQINKNLNS